MIIFVLLFFVSDSAFKIMQGSEAEMGKLLDYQGVMACFADPTIILFLGGFVLAIAATQERTRRDDGEGPDCAIRQAF